MAKGKSVAFNVLIILGMFALSGALIGLVPLVRSSKPTMPAESPEIAAKRHAPDNAYFVLIEAVEALPKTPSPVSVPDIEVPKAMVKYRPEKDSLGEILGIGRPDDDPELVQYLRDCDKAIAKTREALGRPYFLMPVGAPQGIIRLGNVFTARGVQSLRAGDEAGGWVWMRDTARLGLLIQGQRECTDVANKILYRVTHYLKKVAQSTSSAALEEISADILEFHSELKPPTGDLEFTLRQIDQGAFPFMRIPRGGLQRIAATAERSLRLRVMKSWARRNLDGLLRSLEIPFPEAMAWWEQAVQRPGFGSSAIDLLTRVRSLVDSRASLETEFRGVILVVALERFRRAHSAYPEALDALAPETLAAVPEDPFSGHPFVYKRVGEDYVLYSVGRNQKDDGGVSVPQERPYRGSDDMSIHSPRTGTG
jgi:hypothetical protein